MLIFLLTLSAQLWSASGANYFLIAHYLTYQDQAICYPYSKTLSVRSLWAAVPLSMTDYSIAPTLPKGWQPIEGEYYGVLPGSCIGSEPGYEGCPQHTNTAYLIASDPKEAYSQCIPGCTSWDYTGLPRCTQEISRCYTHTSPGPEYVEYNTSAWDWSLTEEELMTQPAQLGSDLWLHQQYFTSGGGLCVCREGCVAKNNMLFLKKDGHFANYHKGCDSVALGLVKLRGVPCYSSDYASRRRKRNPCAAGQSLTKAFCADKELYVPSRSETTGGGKASFGASTSIRLAHFMEEASCATVRVGNEARDALMKLSADMHSLQIYANQARVAVDFNSAAQGGGGVEQYSLRLVLCL